MTNIGLNQISGFEWDEGNKEKNWKSHQVMSQECEEVFADPNYYYYEDHKHSLSESRFGISGKTFTGRLLRMVFTIRNNKIRIITARDMNKKERSHYGAEKK